MYKNNYIQMIKTNAVGKFNYDTKTKYIYIIYNF